MRGAVTARVEADGVSIRLPRLCVQVEQRQAERLRDQLNTVLPTNGTRRYVLILWDDAHPELSEPCETERERTEMAQDMRRAHGDDHGLYRLTVGTDGTATVAPFRGDELTMPKPTIRVPVHVGDRVLDPLDGQWREVTKVTGLAVVFADGCTMGIREAEEAEKRLPSEPLPQPCPACEAWADGGRILTAQEWIDGRDDLCDACIKAGRGAGMRS